MFRKPHVALGLATLVAWASAPAPLAGQQEQQPIDPAWASVTGIKPGQEVILKRFKGTGKGVSGKLVAADATGLTVRTRHSEERIERETVRELRMWTPGRRATGAIGAVILLGGLGTQLGANIWALRAPKGEIRQAGFLPTAVALGGVPLIIIGRPHKVYQNRVDPKRGR